MFLSLAALVRISAVTPCLAQDDISLLVPEFESYQGIVGGAVSSVLGLQVWRTLVRARGDRTFGVGNVYWGPKLVSPPSYKLAELRARSVAVLAQMVLWGEVFEFGDGVIAETFLSLPDYQDFREKRNEVWEIEAKNGATLKADLPRRRYAFEPIILKREFVDKYRAVAGLVVYKDKSFRLPTGVMGVRFKALQVLPHAAKIKSGDRTGWIPLVTFSSEGNEVVDFIGGLFRIYRGDWEGARDMFQRVLNTKAAPTEIRVDAALLRARATAEMGLDPEYDIRTAERSGSITRTTIVYAVMADIQIALMKHNRDFLLRARNRLEDSRVYFTRDDPWLVSIQGVLPLLLDRIK